MSGLTFLSARPFEFLSLLHRIVDCILILLFVGCLLYRLSRSPYQSIGLFTNKFFFFVFLNNETIETYLFYVVKTIDRHLVVNSKLSSGVVFVLVQTEILHFPSVGLSSGAVFVVLFLIQTDIRHYLFSI